MNKRPKLKTSSLVVLLIAAFVVTSFAGLQFVATARAAGYTEYAGTLGGAGYVVRFPEHWNGMLVVICRGYSGGPTFSNASVTVGSAMLNRSFAVAASNYGSGGFCIQAGVDSTYQLTKYIIDTYHVKRKVFLYGLSMGGAVALLLAEKYPDIYSGVLDLFGTKDLKDQHATKSRWANLSDAALTAELTALGIPVPPPGYASVQALRTRVAPDVPAFELETGGTPATQSKAYEDRSATYHANIKIPVITVHGTFDTIVPFYESVMYQTAVGKAGRSSLYRLYNVSGGYHASSTVMAEASKRFEELVRWSAELDNTFSIMQISDTQHLPWLSPTLYNDTTSWIVNNSAAYNLQMVIHTGDFIDQPGYNQSQLASEWANANASMSKLLDAGIPYCWAAGNHDQTPFYNASGTSNATRYTAFNGTHLRSKPYWVSDIYDSKNTAVKFAFKGFPFIVIALENMANSSALAWMKGLLDKNTGANVIIATHGYLNNEAGYGIMPPPNATNPVALALANATTVWAKALKVTMDGYSNVFLTLSGHIAGVNMTRVGNREEILFNRQGASNSTNAASVRVYTFNLTNKQVQASTYCLDTKTWLMDNYNQFTFSASTLIPLATPALAASAFSSVNVISGWTWYFFAHSTGGFGPHFYQWYEGTTLLAGQTSMVLPITKTSPGAYIFICKVTDFQGTTTNSNNVTLTVIG